MIHSWYISSIVRLTNQTTPVNRDVCVPCFKSCLDSNKKHQWKPRNRHYFMNGDEEKEFSEIETPKRRWLPVSWVVSLCHIGNTDHAFEFPVIANHFKAYAAFRTSKKRINQTRDLDRVPRVAMKRYFRMLDRTFSEYQWDIDEGWSLSTKEPSSRRIFSRIVHIFLEKRTTFCMLAAWFIGW